MLNSSGRDERFGAEYSPRLRFHDICHSTASILYDKGWQLKDISEWIGHADLSTTGNIYTHITMLRKENVGKDLGSLFHL